MSVERQVIVEQICKIDRDARGRPLTDMERELWYALTDKLEVLDGYRPTPMERKLREQGLQ